MTRINTNVPSLVAQNRLNSSNQDLQQALTRLSTGLRINSGSDDPAGLIASEALRSEITSLGKAVSNTRRASQIISTADSALGQVSNLLNDVRGLVVEAANKGALSDDEIAANQLQIDSSLEAVNRIAQTTTFQGRKLLDGGLDFLTTAGTNFTNITNLNIGQANLGTVGSLNVSVSITEAAKQASLTIPTIPVSVASVTAAGSLDLSTVVTAAAATGTATLDGIAPDAEAASTAITLGSGGDFTITAKDGGDFDGTAGNLNIILATVATGTASTIDTSTPGQITVTLQEGETLADIATLLNGSTEFDLNVGTGGTVGVSDTFTGATELTGGTDTAGTASFDVTAAADGEAFNGNIIVNKVNGATTAAALDADGNIVVTIDDTGTTSVADIQTAIDDLAEFDAAGGITGGVTSFDNTSTLPTDGIIGATTGGATAGTFDALINLTAKEDGDAANASAITFAATGAPGSGINVTVTDGAVAITVPPGEDASIADIVAAIQAEGTYDAELATGATLTNFNSTTGADTITPTNFADGVNASGGLAQDAVFELIGKSGSEVFNVSAGTGVDDLVTQINLVSDATGVTAARDGQDLVLTSTEYGSDAIVDLRVIKEADGGTIKTSPVGSGQRVEGRDIKAKVNGIDASGTGNTLSINTSTLDISITVADGSSDSVGFQISGGGALFQLGADVVSNQQARIGIGSVSSARLGGSSGRLFELGSGEEAALDRDPNLAARIVTDAIDQVTSIRGRLGAFQSTTLDSNIISLQDTLANLQEAESSIRDADFAQESANLTRAQILVQSGTNVLSLANQNPQSVLSLLR